MDIKKKITIFLFLLVLVNILLYMKVTNYEFLNYDDDRYVTDNRYIEDFSGRNLKKIFTKTFVANYQPVTILSYSLDHSLYKMEPAGFHLTNMILHTINGVLLLLLLYLISGNAFFSFLIALIFSVHPLQVESVAWVSERKGLLCAFFYFLSFISYVYFSRDGKKRFYAFSLALFALALLSKPIAVTFPIILLLYDYYEGKLDRSRIIRKIPFFVLAVIFSIVTVMAQRSYDAVNITKAPLILKNFLLAFYAVGFYAGKLILPINLCAHYIYPDVKSFLSTEYTIAVFMIALLIFYLINIKKIKKEINFGVFFFLVTIVPIVRILPLGDTFAADRYMYMPIIGFFTAFIVAANGLIKKRPGLEKAFTVILFAYIFFFAVLNSYRAPVWKNSKNLWEDVVSHYPSSFMPVLGLKREYYDVMFQLGDSYTKRGDYERAREYYMPLISYENLIRQMRAYYINEYQFKSIFPLARHKIQEEKALYKIALTYLYENDSDKAKEYLSTLLEKYPGNKEAKEKLDEINGID